MHRPYLGECRHVRKTHHVDSNPFLSTEHRLRWAGGGSLLLGEIPWLKLSFNN